VARSVGPKFKPQYREKEKCFQLSTVFPSRGKTKFV
jgi:hypothetical protein